MGFTKIYKQTMPDFAQLYMAGNYNYGALLGGNLSYKDWNGATHTGFVMFGAVGSSSPYTIYAGRNSLFAQMSGGAANFTLPSTSSSNSARIETYMALGSGNSEEREDSYDLDSRYTHGTDFSATVGGTATAYDSGTDKVYRSRSITVTAINDITIREIGIYLSIWNSRTSASTYSWTPPVLMYRKVLSMPISLLAGQSITLDLRIAGG